MIVCVCRRISDRDLQREAAACDSFDELQFCTGVATGCGRCGECARAVFEQVRTTPSPAARAASGHLGASHLSA